jgi:DNA-binding NarL/FixJ family response regulator
MQIQDLIARVWGETGLGELTQRQMKVAVMISQGSTDRDIMQNLHCSIYTVRSEIEQIIDKLGANNRAHIAYFVGLRQGIEWCHQRGVRNDGKAKGASQEASSPKVSVA